MVFSLQIFKKELAIEDLAYLSKLLDSNIPLIQCIGLLKNNRNKDIFEKINKDLSNGLLIEDIIKDYVPKGIKDYLLPLLKTLTFSNALSLALEFYESHDDSKNQLIKEIAYPCILLFVSVTILYLFDLYGIDSIFGLISSFKTDINIYKDFRIMFKIFINIFYYSILLGTLLVVYFIQPKRIVLLYMLISKKFDNSLFNIYYSQEFVSLLLTCINKGYKSKESLQILMQMKSKPIVSFLAFHLDEALMEGESLKDATKKDYYDSSLSKFIKIANYTNEFSAILYSYTKLCKEKIKRKIKKYTLTIQISTYSIIGIIVIFIYQILFIPMQVLSSY